MKHTLILLALIAVAGGPAGAQPAPGMAAMQYYVGSWSCAATNVGRPPTTATLTYTLDTGVLRQWVIVPAQGKMTQPYVISIATTYDAKNGRYVQTGLDSIAAWWVSYGTLSGNTEQWTDHANSDKLGRAQAVRTDDNSFVFMGYDTVASTQPNFQATCRRSM